MSGPKKFFPGPSTHENQNTGLRAVMFARTVDDVEAVRLLLKPFFRADYSLFPLSKGKKQPRDVGWQKREYSQAELKRWVAHGGNIGIALQTCDLVIDIDPRNFAEGDDPFRRLRRELGVDLGLAPTVLSGRGDGGRHIYYRKPTALRIRGRLEGYEGIDFKSKGGFVLAPGSIHPETGGIYMPDDFAPPIGAVKTAPRALLERLAQRQYAAPVDNRIGNITNEQLALLLSALDPADYGQGHYDDFIRLAAACHDATQGAGLAVWLEWCAGDPAYGDDTAFENNIRHWESFTAGQPGGATFRTLLRAVADAGRPDLVAALDGHDAGFSRPDIGREDLPGHDFTNMEETLQAQQRRTLAALGDAHADVEANRQATKAALKEMRDE